MSKRPKSVVLRAFFIKSTDTSVRSSDVLHKLRERLKESIAKDRQMILSSEDPDSEHDILSNFSLSENTMTGTILRIIPKGHDEHIEAALFEKRTFSLDEIKGTEVTGASLYRKHIFIGTDGLHIVTNLPRNNTIQGVETYINWLLGTYIFEFYPVIERSPDMKLSDVKSITFSGSQDIASETAGKSYSFFSVESIKKLKECLLNDSANMEDIEIEQIMSAKLILQLKKPKDMTEEEYQRKYSALLKPVSDLENVSFENKNGDRIKADKIAKEKKISIEVTERGFLSERQLNIEMERFLNELKNDKKDT